MAKLTATAGVLVPWHSVPLTGSAIRCMIAMRTLASRLSGRGHMAARQCLRKVRAPQGRVLGNAQ